MGYLILIGIFDKYFGDFFLVFVILIFLIGVEKHGDEN